MKKDVLRILALVLAISGTIVVGACDTPRENATEEKVEDAGEAAGMSEDAAEQRGEAVKDGTATDTSYTGATTDTGATTVTTDTGSTTVTTTT